ncbi:MAG: J domain-containing protein [Desulfohalobiaceae bacterium]
MQVNESYQILGISQEADLEEIKSAYRRQAFACHPDLHPDDPQAGAKFQRLNQAYVFLLELRQQEAEVGQNTFQSAYARHKAQQEYTRTQTRKESTRQAHRSRQQAKASKSGEREKTRHWERYFSQEEILKNILNDPFARQVFEDIFRKIKKKKPELKRMKPGLQGKSLQLPWLDRELDLSRISPSSVKLWLRSQLDHEHTIYLHPRYLLPGCSVRFQLQQGPRSEPQTITTTIPKDYQAGRPLRLKGLGRRLGPWRGDLYLRLMSK